MTVTMRPVILVVDDEPKNIKLMTALLQAEGYEVVGSHGGQDALDRLHDIAPDVILLDVMMPGMSGIEVTAQLKGSTNGHERIPVVVITAHDDHDVRIQALRAGAEDFLTRPVNRHELSSRLNNLLRLKRLDDELRAQNEHLHDLVAQKAAELIDSERFLRDTLNALSAHIAIVDENDVIVKVNEPWRRFADENGFRGRGAVGSSFLSATDVEQSEAARRFSEGLARVRTGEIEEYVQEYQSRGPDDSWYLCRITRFTEDDHGYLVIAHENITDGKRAELALAATEAEYRAMVDTSPAVIARLDRDGIVGFCNRGLRGEPSERFVGRSIFDEVHPEDVEDVRDAVRHVYELQEPAPAFFRVRSENRTLHLGGGFAPLIVDGACEAVIAIMGDLTEQQNLERQVQTGQRLEAIGKLAGGVAHDFNNLLMSIIVFTTFVFDSFEEDDPRREDLGEVLAAADRAAALTNQLLQFSRQQPSTLESIDVNKTIENLVRMLSRTLGEDVELRVSLADDPVVVLADESQLDQLIVNLAVNARDAMPDGGALSISLDVEAGPRPVSSEVTNWARIDVTDTGIGMDQETLSRIFEPFFTTKGPTEGTGLGLATCYGVVQQLGGEIEVSSTPGEGTTFSIFLPLTAEITRRSGHDLTPLSVRGVETILVVEDEPAVRRIAERALREQGYEVIVAEDADRARELLDEHGQAIEVLFTDIVLPRGSGTALAAWVAEHRPDMAILLTSGYADGRSLQESSEFPVIWKPYAPADLAVRLRACIDEKRDMLSADTETQ